MTSFAYQAAAQRFDGFIAFEISPAREVITVGLDDACITVTDPLTAEFWTLYGRASSGQAVALYDAPDEEAVAARLATAFAASPRPITYQDEERRIDEAPTIAALADAITNVILDDIEEPDTDDGQCRDDAFDSHPLAPLREALIAE